MWQAIIVIVTLVPVIFSFCLWYQQHKIAKAKYRKPMAEVVLELNRVWLMTPDADDQEWHRRDWIACEIISDDHAFLPQPITAYQKSVAWHHDHPLTHTTS